MIDSNFLLKFKFFCDSYKAYVSYLQNVLSEGSKYRIDVYKTVINDDITRINLSIYDTRYDRSFEKYYNRDKANNNLNYLNIPIDVNNSNVEFVINHIIKDFYYNHHILYTGYNNNNSSFTIHNTYFELCIRCNDKDDTEAMLKIKDEINASIKKKIRTANH